MEGAEDARVIPELVEANGIIWGESKQQAIVDIQVFDGSGTCMRCNQSPDRAMFLSSLSGLDRTGHV